MKKIIPIIHVVLILAAYSSPFWLNWEIVLAGVFIYYIQLIVFGACVLSIAQYNNKETSFVANGVTKILNKLKIKIKPTSIKFVLNFIIPPSIAILAYVIQVVY